MSYVQGFITPALEARKDDYVRLATNAVELFVFEGGATRTVEAWPDDVPDGTVTDFRRAVAAEDGEAAVLSWIEYPSREVYDQVNRKMAADPKAEEMMRDMPVDGARMIFGGFKPFVDVGSGRGGYVDGFVLPVAPDKRGAYEKLATDSAAVFQKYGALRVVEAWGDDVPDGKVTDFKRSVQAKDGEGVVFSFIEWPDKATRVAGWEKVMADPGMQPSGDMPFDGKRMFWGGFTPVVDA